MGETEAVGGKVAGDKLKDEETIVDAETCEEGASDANREDVDKERGESNRKWRVKRRSAARTTGGEDCSYWRQKMSKTSFTKSASTVRSDTI